MASFVHLFILLSMTCLFFPFIESLFMVFVPSLLKVQVKHSISSFCFLEIVLLSGILEILILQYVMSVYPHLWHMVTSSVL